MIDYNNFDSPATKSAIVGFLDDLRASGTVNMFSAPSIMKDTFGMDHKTSIKWFTVWTDTVNDRANRRDS